MLPRLFPEYFRAPKHPELVVSDDVHRLTSQTSSGPSQSWHSRITCACHLALEVLLLHGRLPIYWSVNHPRLEACARSRVQHAASMLTHKLHHQADFGSAAADGSEQWGGGSSAGAQKTPAQHRYLSSCRRCRLCAAGRPRLGLALPWRRCRLHSKHRCCYCRVRSPLCVDRQCSDSVHVSKKHG